MDDFREFFLVYQDHAATRLDVYEQAIYLYIARHTIAVGNREAVIGFKSARKEMAFGTGKAGTPPSEGIIYKKLGQLDQKGFVEILSTERAGTRVKILKPFEKDSLKDAEKEDLAISLEEADFFEDEINRNLILERDGYKCFYCLRDIDENNYVIEHVVSRPEGSNSYRNLVSSCRRCNNRKGASAAPDFLRTIYREGLITQFELTDRLEQLQRLAAGELKPGWPVK